MKMILLLIAHFLGDYIFQSNTIAREKQTKTHYFLLHCGIYFICILPFCAIFGTIYEIVMSSALIAFLHGAVDGVKIAFKREKSIALYLLDQFLHIVVMIIMSFILPDPNSLGTYLSRFLQQQIPQIPLVNIAMALLFYLICSVPAGVTIKFILSKVHVTTVKPKEGNGTYEGAPITTEDMTAEQNLDSGFVIGVLERFCILTLAILGQFTAISFVIAAKSLARIKKLDNEEFAEKYLVGTFLSVLIAVGFCHCLNSLTAITVCL